MSGKSRGCEDLGPWDRALDRQNRRVPLAGVQGEDGDWGEVWVNERVSGGDVGSKSSASSL
jgi:hypothetical protein